MAHFLLDVASLALTLLLYVAPRQIWPAAGCPIAGEIHWCAQLVRLLWRVGGRRYTLAAILASKLGLRIILLTTMGSTAIIIALRCRADKVRRAARRVLRSCPRSGTVIIRPITNHGKHIVAALRMRHELLLAWDHASRQGMVLLPGLPCGPPTHYSRLLHVW